MCTNRLQRKYAEVEELYERHQVVQEKVLGPEHPSLVATLNNRGEALVKQVRAARKYQRKSCGALFA